MSEQPENSREFRSWRNRSAAKAILPILLLAAAILIFFAKLAFTNLILARGDTFLYFYPYWEAASTALRSGRLPLWNPDLFMGAPFLANSQVGFFYPLNWPVWMLFRVPYALKASIIIHLLIAAAGSYLAARKSLGLGRWAACFTAVLFSLSGYLTGQVEHINQLQGLAWLPWFLPLLSEFPTTAATARQRGRSVAGIGLLFTLQLLAGHAQTTFITGVGLLVWIVSPPLSSLWRKGDSHRQPRWAAALPGANLWLLAGGVVLGLLAAAVQLLPTFELSGLSSRQGGMPINEVLSFSLNPLLFTRALLPNYLHPLFTEYGAMMPVTALILALLGAWHWRSRKGALSGIALVVVGLFLALGSFNPLNWLLMRLPGFDLFRAPARWMALYTLGVSMLAGIGWQVMWDRVPRRNADVDFSPAGSFSNLRTPVMIALLLLGLLMLWGAAANAFTTLVPVGPEAPFEFPRIGSVLIWLIEIAAFILLWRIAGHAAASAGSDARIQRFGALAPIGLIVISLASLFVTTRAHPYNNLTTPEAYFDLRPSVSRILADQNCLELSCDGVKGRFLSLSDIFFEPGDTEELNTIYQDQLTSAALYDYIVAIKQKEIIAPNLSLVYGLPSVDGFDGGILPLRSYSRLMQLLLPDRTITSDGRLREHLDAVPSDDWLDLFNVQFVITDKVGDLWRDGVFFDRQHPVTLGQGGFVSVGYLPQFESTEIQLVADSQPGAAELLSVSGAHWLVDAEELDQGLYRYQLPAPAVLKEIKIHACLSSPTDTCSLSGISLVDSRDGAFQSILFGSYRLVHSGDVKIYQNLDVLPRAFTVHDWEWYEDADSAVEALGSAEPDLSSKVFLTGSGPDASNTLGATASRTAIQSYKPEAVSIEVETNREGFLILTDAYYPGWKATLDGEPAEVLLADGIFRAVSVPAGTHLIEFKYTPAIVQVGLAVSVFGVLALLLLSLLPGRTAANSKP